MKKLFLSLVFVFAFVAVTPTNASNTISKMTDDMNVHRDCISLAFFIDDFSGGITYEEFAWVVDQCEAMPY